MSTDQGSRKGVNEAFAKFFENPTRPSLRELLQQDFGEFDHLDFKENWPDGPKLARHILGFANTNGGVIVVGIKEAEDGTLVRDGLTTLKDKTDISNSVKRFLPDELAYTVINFSFDETEYAPIKGKKFQVLIVNDKPENIPFICLASSGDEIREGAIFVRHGAATTQGTHNQVQRILNRRLATGHSTSRELTLREHIDELKMLYGQIPETVSNGPAAFVGLSYFVKPNPSYPEETYDTFIAGAIGRKKQLISEFLAQPR